MTALPDWVEPLYEAAEMRAADAWAIEEQGVPEADLMERAGLGLARVTAAAAGAGPVRIVVGKGNNGGDGLVAARLLGEDGYEVEVLDGTQPFDRGRLEGSGVVVDALLGTGFEGAPREPVASAIWAINQQDAPVVACDVPSGVNASTGEVEADAVRAAVTATFHGSKLGLHVNPGKEHAGRVEVIEIGIPRGAPEASSAGLIAERVLALYPRRKPSGSKFESGVVVVVGGSMGLTGAPTMAARAAGRAGAGYVQVAVPGPVQPAVDLRLLEQMSRGLPDDDGFHTPAGVAEVEEMAERAGAVVLGPGIGRADGAQEFARGAALAVEVPLLVDADGLNAHAGRLELFREREAATVLTPHEAELARLLEVSTEEVSGPSLAARARGRRAERRGCAAERRRHHRRPAGRPGGHQPRGHPGARNGRHGRRAVRTDRSPARKGDGRVRGGVARRARARAGRPRGGGTSRPRPRDGGRRDRGAAPRSDAASGDRPA